MHKREERREGFTLNLMDAGRSESGLREIPSLSPQKVGDSKR